MNSITKMAVLPLSVAERLSKYDTDLQHITNLIDADKRRDRILASKMDPMTAHLAYTTNQIKLDQEKDAVFGHRQLVPETTRVQNIAHKPVPNFPAHSWKERQIPIPQTPSRHESIEDDNFADAIGEPIKAETPAEPPIVQNLLEPGKTHELSDDDDDDLDDQKEENPNVSLTTQRRYTNRRTMKELLLSGTPRGYVDIAEDGTVSVNDRRLMNSNIDGILNYLTTPNSQYVAGSGTIMDTLYRVPGFDENIIENPKAISNYQTRFGERRPRPFTAEELENSIGGGRGAKRFVVIKRLPCDLK